MIAIWTIQSRLPQKGTKIICAFLWLSPVRICSAVNLRVGTLPFDESRTEAVMMMIALLELCQESVAWNA
jgi:hypothetical protein